MRFTAIMFVLINHAIWNFPDADGPVFFVMKNLGFLGVELFFVLSGFLIGRILFNIFTSENFSGASLRYFLIRRWFRTLPAYFLVLVINIMIVIWIGRALPDTLWRYFGFLQNTHFAMDLFFTESWSLPIEEFAYVIGPFLLYLTMFLRTKISKTKLFLIITLSIIAFFTVTKISYNMNAETFSMQQWNSEVKAVVIYRIDAIYYGVLAAILSLVKPKFWERRSVLLLQIGAALFFALQLVFQLADSGSYAFQAIMNIVYLPITSISIALALPFLSKMKNSTSVFLKPITVISMISYSMYLLHYSIVLQVMRLYVVIEELSMLEKWLLSFAYIIVTTILAYFLYRFYEKPMMDLRDRPFFRKNLKS